jgi:hypothetical protein
MNITYSGYLFVALGIQYAIRMRRIICDLPRSTNIFFSTLSHKWHDFWKKVIKHKLRVLFYTKFVWNIFHSKNNGARYDKNVFWSASCKVPFIPVRFYWNLNFLNRFSNNFQISNLMEIRPVVAQLFHADGRADRCDEASTNLSQFYESTYKLITISEKTQWLPNQMPFR